MGSELPLHTTPLDIPSPVDAAWSKCGKMRGGWKGREGVADGLVNVTPLNNPDLVTGSSRSRELMDQSGSSRAVREGTQVSQA